jgi:hypothetical protein
MGHQGLPVLHSLSQVTFFTLDRDFFRLNLRHACYSLVWLDVREDDAALYLRRFLGHPRFWTARRRMGTVVRVHPAGVHFWQIERSVLQATGWP